MPSGGHRMGTSNKRRGSYPATVTPTTRELEWAAGFMEGEGSFRQSNCERVSVAQVNPEPLGRMLTWFGGRVKQYKKNRPNESDIWVWSVTGARARGIMMTLYPLLSTKRQGQIEAALAGHKYT